jgi:GTP-binding protein
MKFLDQARILVSGGSGGNGVTAFRREKFVPRGGPSGGDGGNGGSVYLKSTEQLNTLLQFRFNPEYKADSGSHGEGSNRHGRDGRDIEVLVPVGTVVSDTETGELIHDFSTAGERICIAPGGRGGRGNARYATSINRAPRYHEDGNPGILRRLSLELKLIADVGLVGFPNAGKSTLISRISAARPKIADYPFTTLEPNLGVVRLDEDNAFVVADIPGLIEGAHTGQGLGLEFLRHIERTKVLLHVVDVSSASGREPVEDFTTIERELGLHNPDLLSKPLLLAASKMDALDDRSRLDRLKEMCANRQIPIIEISSVTGRGIDELIRAMGKMVQASVNSEATEPALALSGVAEDQEGNGLGSAAVTR